MKEIPLTQGKVAIVDDEDYTYLNQWKWYANKERRRWYAMRTDSRNNGKHNIRMHRLIMNIHNSLDCDHINSNGLDNRRVNLRICTRSKNLQNQRMQLKIKTSIFKGVTWNKRDQKWKAYLQLYPKRYIFLGSFKDEIDAAKAYDEGAKKHYGEFAKLNFCEELAA